MNRIIKKRLIIISLIIIILIFRTGCSRLSAQKRANSETAGGGVLNDKIYQGTKGITMKFMKNLPPRRIYDNNDLSLVLEIKNEGAHKTDGKVFLTGYDPVILRGIDNNKRFRTLEGKNKFNLQGDIETIEFKSNIIKLPEGSDSYNPKFLATMCYQYETLSNPVVCIDPKFYDVSVEDKACLVRDVSTGGGQGAPIGVDVVRVDSVKDKAHFRIEISNFARGKVVNHNDCPFNLKYDDLNKIQYQVKMAGQRPEKCSPTREVRLVNGKGTIFCSFNIPSQNQYAYSTPLEIKLNYGYMDSIAQEVEIVKIPK